MSIFQIEIPRRSTHCVGCKCSFPPSSDYFSLLTEDKEGFKRFDYCPSCWEKTAQEGIHWKSKVPDNSNAALEEKYRNRNEKALALLKDALLMDTPEADSEAFILALLLARSKVASLRQEIEQEGKFYNLYEILDTEEILVVPKVNLSSLQIDTLQTDLANKLKL